MARFHLNPEKLYHSKWTAVRVENRERHFLVVELIRDEKECVREVILEAVLTGNSYRLDYRDLEDRETWHVGWLY